MYDERRVTVTVGSGGKKSLNFQRLRPNNGISNENAGREEKGSRAGRSARGLNAMV